MNIIKEPLSNATTEELIEIMALRTIKYELLKRKLMVMLVNIIMQVLAKAYIHKEQTSYASMLDF